MSAHPFDLFRRLRRALSSFERGRHETDTTVTATWEFGVDVQADELDGGYVAHSPDLVGCWSQGETPEETRANFAEAVEAWLAARLDDSVDAGPAVSPHIQLRSA